MSDSDIVASRLSAAILALIAFMVASELCGYSGSVIGLALISCGSALMWKEASETEARWRAES